MARIRDCLYEDTTRHGTLRYRFGKDRDSPRITLPGKPGDAAFEDAYKRLLAGKDIRKSKSERPVSKYAPCTFGDLAEQYFAHMDELLDAKKLALATHKQRHNLIGRVMPILRDGQMRTMEPRHIRLVMQQFKSTPHQANNLLKSLRAMFKYGVNTGYLEADPSVGVESNSKVSDGFRPWEIEHVRAFFAHHELGTKANLAMTLLIITACRRSDLVRLGPGNCAAADHQH